MSKLPEVLKKAQEGETFIVTQNNIAVAQILPPQPRRARVPGSAKSKLIFMADDFDDALEDFAEYR